MYTATINKLHKALHKAERRKKEVEKREKPEKRKGLSKSQRKALRKQEAEEERERQTQLASFAVADPDFSTEALERELREFESQMPLERKLALIRWEFRPRKEYGFVPVGISTRNHCSYGLKAYYEKPAPQVTEITYCEHEE